ncbi:MAG: sulfur carrier protein ThiS [Gemmatimonadota bacterium]|jgi:thiamine biosynthesis protein ThiS
MIRVRLNGQDREIEEEQTVQQLLLQLDLRPELVVVERNREILSRDRYPHVRVEDGDTLELVHFVGGG